jgi:hypothetical protein
LPDFAIRSVFLIKYQQMKIKSRYVSALFVALFSLYAVSPLSCALTGNGTAVRSIARHRSSSVIRTVRIFFWELVCSQLAATEDGSFPPSTDRILISKMRAVTSGTTIFRMTHPDTHVPEGFYRPVDSGWHRMPPEGVTGKPVSGVLLLCSGLSPPVG